MTGEEFVIAMTAVVCGTALFGYVIGKVTGLINQWINRKKGGEFGDEDFERLAKAFMHHKKQVEQRIQNLEAIVSDDEGTSEISYPEIEEPKSETNLNNALKSRNEKQGT